MKKKIAIVTLFLAQYRKGFLDRIFSNESYEITVYCQKDIEGLNLKLIHGDYPTERVKVVTHFNFYNFVFIWQNVPWIEIYKEYDYIFIDGNPRVLNHFLMASIYPLLGKKIILWSMVHSFKDNKMNEWLRVNWMRMFKNHFLYNEGEIKYLTSIGFRNKTMMAMNNGLDQERIDVEIEKWPQEKLIEWRLDTYGEDFKFDIITLGRLLPNKYEDLFYALKEIRKKYPLIKCCIIGDGVAKESLLKLREELGLSENIHFAGALYLESELCPYMLSSKMCVHPTAMGLTIMHVFGYSLPVVTHDEYSKHGPEIVAMQDGQNGLLYKYNDNTDMVSKILMLMDDSILLNRLSKNANKLVKEKYNTNMMANNFIELVSKIK
jgi:glycosyltransferase involved in cell wall biosynthesis